MLNQGKSTAPAETGLTVKLSSGKGFSRMEKNSLPTSGQVEKGEK